MAVIEGVLQRIEVTPRAVDGVVDRADLVIYWSSPGPTAELAMGEWLFTEDLIPTAENLAGGVYAPDTVSFA